MASDILSPDKARATTPPAPSENVIGTPKNKRAKNIIRNINAKRPLFIHCQPPLFHLFYLDKFQDKGLTKIQQFSKKS